MPKKMKRNERYKESKLGENYAAMEHICSAILSNLLNNANALCW